MTREETAEMLAILKAAYPHSFQNITRADGMAMLNLWTRMFEADSKNEVSAAIDALISNRTVGYSPTPGEVKEQMRKLRDVHGLNELEAWGLVSKACTNGIYGYKEEFARLPAEVQRAVGRPEQLREWAMMDSETVQSVVASNFQRTYRAQIQKDNELSKLPPSVTQLISGISERMMLGD